jgi:S-DNA-T family DNA segregation ATPase FtsK/SpoIIIE
MGTIDIQVLLSNRFRTSAEADKVTGQLWPALGLETKAQFARLAIGRSLAMGKFIDEQNDAKGIEVPAQALFTVENIGAWVGLIVSHSSNFGETISTPDAFRNAVRNHWHRGALDLWKDWVDSGESYDKFVESLISRRTEMPEESGSKNENGTSITEPVSPPSSPADQKDLLKKALVELGISVQINDVIHGPRMTRYKVLLLNLADSSKLSRNLGQLALAMNLGDKLPAIANGDVAKTVFIDVPRPRSSWQSVSIDKLTRWASLASQDSNKLNVYVGVDVVGEDVSFDLASAPHLLVGGTTGAGKSVCLHSLILSLLLQNDKNNLKLALIDPKRVEFANYSKLSNLYKDSIATEISEAKEFLKDLVDEMEARYSDFEKLNVSNIYEARKKGRSMPFIVLLIEEMADLILQDKGIEPLIVRLVAKARASGIHLVVATQRPDSETFSGLLRSNVPTRIALTVQKGSESRIILDEQGAENLLGAGDMLLKIPGEQIRRAHGVFVKQEDIASILTKL